MEWIRSQKEIEAELQQIRQSNSNTLVSYDKSITYCQTILEGYRVAVISQGFPDEASEIRFFKNHKPFLLGHLFRCRHLLSFELEFANISGDLQKDIIKAKMLEVNTFLSNHKDMILYVELENQRMDAQYFLRKNRQLYAWPSPIGVSFDPEFSSSHDGLLAHIKGLKGYLEFLHNKLCTPNTLASELKTPIAKIKWTEAKIALTELGFALFYSGAIDHGNTSLKSVMEFLERVTGMDLGDYHHTSIRIRNRSNPTKFMDKLRKTLQNWTVEMDD
ncbi:RteC protein [Arenibacter nanhaiticus]|uniref:RteC protein n=1 Tax=Arenibacter nanhaiticus TaxID=558155 RepID=A0A1M6KWK9_9FLAO|nr:RteC domain-containing protein [Arenibacter nanhaiticus]SHJ63294.1 RteC protein [Arenibacter nanhaiticus]